MIFMSAGDQAGGHQSEQRPDTSRSDVGGPRSCASPLPLLKLNRTIEAAFIDVAKRTRHTTLS